MATPRGLVLVAVPLLASLFLLSPSAFAAESIVSMDSRSVIGVDASVEVTETIVYDFDGTPDRHGIYRDIPFAFTTADGRAGSLSFSNISATDSSGTSYPVSLSAVGGNEHIRIGDPNITVSGVKTYVISYTVRGAITPYDTFDELYWNATGDEWQIPIYNSSSTVVLPASIPVSQLRIACYMGLRGSKASCPSTAEGSEGGRTTVLFPGGPLVPGEGLTVAVGFPKGLVSYPLPVPWWQEWLLSLIAGALLLGAIIFAIIFALRDQKGRGTIIPIYEPPQGLRPAEANVLVHGRVGHRAWPATIVDLAVRGYVKIAEDTPTPLWMSGGFWGLVFAAVVVIGLLSAIFLAPGSPSTWDGVKLIAFFALGMGVIVFVSKGWLRFNVRRKDYIVTKVAPVDRSKLEGYEDGFLTALFGSDETFSTRELRKGRNQSKRRSLYLAITGLETELRKETASDTRAYSRDPEQARKTLGLALAIPILAAAAFGFIIKFAGGSAIDDFLAQLGGDEVIALILAVLAVFTAAYPVYMRPRLNKEGSIEREQWLGFKLYLETAEKYRLQNLTPDQFQKFLPYAMVFGIEKKWARAFEGIAMPPPEWYSGSAAAGAFSASTFTSSFSSSFSSSFASSGAGGASGGGGGAGGGGGGGGGGGW